MNLTAGEVYSLVFTVGDPNKVVEGMTITINGAPPFDVPRCEDSYKKILISATVPDSGPYKETLQIVFHDTDPLPVNYYWAVGDLTIQHGNRIINVSGGK
jgi:hypothetical protein